MKGWVYVISNKSMPGLVKVGFSKNDPGLRAEELNHTGTPHPYVVEYEMLIEEPYEIEQNTHKLLSSKLEGKEWFRCSAEEAVAAIKQVSGTRIITETYQRADRDKAEALYQRELEAQELRRQRELEAQEVSRHREQVEKDLEDRLRNEEALIRKKYEGQIAASFSPRPFWNYWLGGVILVAIGLGIFYPKISDVAGFMFSLIVGAVAGFVLQKYIENMRKQSSSCIALEKQRDEELVAARRKEHLAQLQEQVDVERYQKAAGQGSAWAQVRLGWMYLKGRGVPQDDAQAVAWFRKAAEQGHASGQTNLGMMCREGLGVPQSDTEAVAWFLKAAEQGHAHGQLNLGVMYRDGRGVSRDALKAHMWGSLAVLNGEAKAGALCDEVGKWLTPRKLSEAQAMAQKCQASNYKNCD